MRFIRLLWWFFLSVFLAVSRLIVIYSGETFAPLGGLPPRRTGRNFLQLLWTQELHVFLCLPRRWSNASTYWCTSLFFPSTLRWLHTSFQAWVPHSVPSFPDGVSTCSACSILSLRLHSLLALPSFPWSLGARSLRRYWTWHSMQRPAAWRSSSHPRSSLPRRKLLKASQMRHFPSILLSPPA